MELVRMERKVTMSTLLKAGTIRSVVSVPEMGEDKVVTILAGMILNLANYLNLGNNFNNTQAIETAFLLVDKYPTESIEDFVYVFRSAKTGDFGKMYNRFDGQIIFEWMDIHLENKARKREELHDKQKQEGIKNDESLASGEGFKKTRDEGLKKWKSALGMDPEKTMKEQGQSVSSLDESTYKQVKNDFIRGQNAKKRRLERNFNKHKQSKDE